VGKDAMSNESAHTPVVRSTAFEKAWLAAAREVAAKNLHGLTAKCPVCGRLGLAFSKWIKGAIQKPLYLCHPQNSEIMDTCELDQHQARQVKDCISIKRDDVRKLLRIGTPFVLFSGGKDSLCLLEYMRRIAGAGGKKIIAIHADTTAGFPEVEVYVRRVCRDLGVKLHVVHPERDFFETAKRWGIPSPRSRWCCETLKVAPIRRFLGGIAGPRVIFDGIRAAESSMRSTYTPVWYHPAFRCLSVSPIFYWSDAKIASYISRLGLPQSPVAELNMSGECWCGAYKGRHDFEALLEVHPEIFDRLVEVERAQKGDYTFIYDRGHQVPLEVIRRGKEDRKA
jgi:3'-phosphoadenosine 5'-phosphosulfate sulfotransferase (PAPS reductase)/FAD synthetase